jgi:hypothetical protein
MQRVNTARRGNPYSAVHRQRTGCGNGAGLLRAEVLYGNNTITSVNLGGIVAPTGFDSATNRIDPNGGASGWNYDLAGDINRDAANVTYAFDAEGRMVAACPTVQCCATRYRARSGRRGAGVLQ